MTIDHMAYIRDRRHRRLVVASLRRFARRQGSVGVATVLHEDDGTCCRLQAWPITAARIAQALEDDGLPALWAVIGGQGVEEVAG